MFAENAFDHVLDTSYWHLFDDVSIHLPLGLTKYMVLMVVAAALIVLIYVPIARRAQTGARPRASPEA